jgi:hypothetical protein
MAYPKTGRERVYAFEDMVPYVHRYHRLRDGVTSDFSALTPGEGGIGEPFVVTDELAHQAYTRGLPPQQQRHDAHTISSRLCNECRQKQTKQKRVQRKPKAGCRFGSPDTPAVARGVGKRRSKGAYNVHILTLDANERKHSAPHAKCRRVFEPTGGDEKPRFVHERAFMGAHSYTCRYIGCDMVFIGKRHRISHESTHLLPKTLFECDFSGCGARFHTDVSLNVHERAQHC